MSLRSNSEKGSPACSSSWETKLDNSVSISDFECLSSSLLPKIKKNKWLKPLKLNISSYQTDYFYSVTIMKKG